MQVSLMKAICEGTREFANICKLYPRQSRDTVRFYLNKLVAKGRLFTVHGVLFRDTPFEEYRWN